MGGVLPCRRRRRGGWERRGGSHRNPHGGAGTPLTARPAWRGAIVAGPTERDIKGGVNYSLARVGGQELLGKKE